MADQRNRDLASIIDHLPEAVILVDDAGVVRLVNRTACELFGMDAERFIGMRYVEAIAGELDGAAVEDGGKGEGWRRLVLSNGDALAVERRERPYQGAPASGTIIFLRENGAEQERVQKLVVARQQAERAANAKSEFLANISHELRTPLNSILGMSELAFELARDREQEEYLRILKLSAESLYGLITSMLDYVKLESGTFNIHDRPFHLKDMVDAIVANFAINCHMKHLGFYVVTEPIDAATYIGDEIRIVQIINNFLSNALKFTSQGEIVLGIRELRAAVPHADPRFADARPLEIWVKDSGSGIPAERLEDIFHPFIQVNPVQNRDVPGTGIGLTITKMLVEAMGGSISVESTVGKGSRFCATVWLKPGGTRRQPDASGILHGTSRCLLVSDSEGWTASLKPWLENIDASVTVCRTVAEFEEAVVEARDQEILCIFQGCFGAVDELLELCRHPYMAAVGKRKQIVSMRIPREEEYHWQSAPFPFQLCFEPLRPHVFFNLIKELEIERYAPERVIAPDVVHSQHKLRILYAEDEAINRMVVVKGLSDAGHEIRAVADGQALVQEYHAGDYDLMVIDIFMPKMNGYEAVSLIRSQEKLHNSRRIPIIALTAHNSPGDRHNAEVLGMNAFLSKPYTPQALLLVIDRVWERELRGGGPSPRSKGKSVYENLCESAVVAIEAGFWENAQRHVQDLRAKFKETNQAEAGELGFRLLLAVRREAGEEALKLIRVLQEKIGVSHESSDRRR